MKRKTLAVAAAATAILLAGAALAHGPGGDPGYGMMGPGQGYGMMGPGQGYGMMHHGPGYGMMGPGAGFGLRGTGPGDCPMFQAAAGQDVTVEGVSAFLERRLAWAGNDRLKLGSVSEQGEDSIVAEIVTQDGSLVERLAFDRHTGRFSRTE